MLCRMSRHLELLLCCSKNQGVLLLLVSKHSMVRGLMMRKYKAQQSRVRPGSCGLNTWGLSSWLPLCLYMQVIKETSALTFMIAGTVKEVVTVITAVIVFRDKFGLINGIGLMIVIAGVLLFNLYKLHKLKQTVRQRIASREGSIEMPADVEPIRTAAEAAGSPKAVVSNGSGALLSSGGSLGAVGSPRTSSIWHAHLHDRLSFSKRRSSVEEAEAEEIMKALEFEPLLPLRV